jgi:ACS family tartrate transporter-like MFS transporter
MDISVKRGEALPLAGAPDAISVSGWTPAEESRVVRRVSYRLIPLLFLCYVIAYVDRINVGFAKLQFQEVLGVDARVFSTIYGLGAGMFFIGYFLFEVPSNLILQRVGARFWIARIMILWGFVSAGFMFVKGVTAFYVMRFLLGAAEAGFFPGVILYLTYWYPPKERARTIAIFAIAGVAAGVIGSPISGAILGMNGVGGLAGWQWLFLLEALPAVAVGLAILVLLPNGPQDARWLNEREKECICARLKAAEEPREGERRHQLWEAFASPVVWLLSLMYFLMNIGGYGYEMWLPSIIKGMSGKGDALVGVMSAVPYFCAGCVMFLVGRHSDLRGERRGHIAFSALSAAIGFAIAGTVKNPLIAFAGLTIAFAGLKSTIAPFWALSTTFLSGTAAAGGIALINSVGNLGGFFGPTIVGYVKDRTGGDFGALLLLGGALLGMAILSFAVPKRLRGMQVVSGK